MPTIEGRRAMEEIFHWSPGLDLGNEVVDQEHRHLFDIANRAVRIWDSGRQRSELKEVLRELHEYVESHFDHEEELMAELGFPELGEHRRQHREIVDAVGRVLDAESDSNLVIGLRELMVNWVLTHIEEEDMKIRDWAHRPGQPGVLARFLRWRRGGA
jgi:hemerythrin